MAPGFEDEFDDFSYLCIATSRVLPMNWGLKDTNDDQADKFTMQAKEPPEIAASSEEFFLAIDGGGTKSAATITSSWGKTATGYAGHSNICYLDVEQCIRTIEDAVTRAIAGFVSQNDPPGDTDAFGASYPEKTFKPQEWPFKKVWAGISGSDQIHPCKRNELARQLEMLFDVSIEKGTLILTHDDMLLTSALYTEETVSTGLSVIAGTGSVCTAFKKQPDDEATIVGRTGGWGPLIGDDGSAFDIGRQALRLVLSDIEARESNDRDMGIALMKPLETEVLRTLDCSSDRVLHTVLQEDVDVSPKHRIANLAKCVTTLAFDVPTDRSDFRALKIIKSSAAELVRFVVPLTKRSMCEPTQSILILGGSLMNVPGYRRLFLEALETAGIPDFKKVVNVDHTSRMAAEMLVNRYADGASDTIEAADEGEHEVVEDVEEAESVDTDSAEFAAETGGYMTDE
ncbi:hypothetical protein KEM56_006917 [Ascosphaera pollenicola]|nr:hypothetical protein KEM56_006917 [Ascosphaera pollenicola]